MLVNISFIISAVVVKPNRLLERLHGLSLRTKGSVHLVFLFQNAVDPLGQGVLVAMHEYVQRLQARNLPISMTEIMHCYENAMAERVNGILKQEYGLGASFKTKALARKAIPEAIKIYNTRRPHSRLSNQFPAVVHAQSMAA